MISDSFRQFGSSDFRKGTDKANLHSYSVVYDPLFAPYKMIATSVLEIGLETGSSLAAFHSYFPHATIYGIDIQDRIYPEHKSLDRIQLVFGDALSAPIVNHFGTSYDIIVEDASHIPVHQKQHFTDFCTLVKPGGVYVIEDVHKSYRDEILAFVKSVGEPLNFTCILHDLTDYKNIPDDNLIVCRRGF
jgi:predicted O-methyltransferase YrrM